MANYCYNTHFRWEFYIWVNMMTPTVSRLYKCNLEATFKIQKLLTGFLYELEVSLLTYTLLLPAHNWMCFTENLKCVLVKHLLHVSTEFVLLSDNCHFPQLLCSMWAAHWADYVDMCKWQPTVVRAKQNSVCNILLTACNGRAEHTMYCAASTMLLYLHVHPTWGHW